MWCRPEPSSVSPIYMPGRLRTASSPFSTLMLSAPYSFGSGRGAEAMAVSDEPRLRIRNLKEFGVCPQRLEDFGVGSRQPRLSAQRDDLFEERAPSARIQMRCDLVEQEKRRMTVLQPGKLPCIGENDGDQKRLLLAGRTLARVGAFFGVANGQVRQVRAKRCAAGFSVADADARQLLAQRDNGAVAMLAQQSIGFAFHRQLRGWKSA